MTTEWCMQEPLSPVLHHNAVLTDKGPPALYRLNTERKFIDGTNKKVRQWTYGLRDIKKQNKIILMVGETGGGKTSMINTMTNYLLGVKFDDQEFYQITEETEPKDQSQSQTSDITVYEVFVEENPTSLTIIDTPGFGNTEEGEKGHGKDREISEYLMRLFSDKDGVHYIDAVCFVMKASQNRLSDREFYIFHSVLSLFGRDIEENIVFLLTYSDGGPPTDALNAIETAGIPCRRDENEPVHFLFNNRQKDKRDQKYEHTYRSSWEMGESSLNRFFTLLNTINRRSVQMTLDVLKDQIQLEACVNNLVQRISYKELKQNELNQIQEALRKNKDKIEKCENFKFTVSRAFKEKVLIENEWPWNSKATCCSVCEENCHEWKCWWAKDPSHCWVMKKGDCTVCTKKCHYSVHVRENRKYVTKTKTVTMTHDEYKQKHDLENIRKEKSRVLTEAYMIIMSLSKITLKSDNAFILQHLDFLIPRLEEEGGKDEWIKNLEDLRKAGEERKNKWALNYLMAFGKKTMEVLCGKD